MPAPPNFRHADTQLLAAFGVGYAVLAVVAVIWLPAVASVVLLGVVLLSLAGLMLHLHRERQDEAVHEQNHIQALVALHALLDLRRPLPPLSRWAASAELAVLLLGIVRERRVHRVVELGGGASSLVLGYALEEIGEGGRVLSLDHDAAYARQTSAEVARHDLAQIVSVVHAPFAAQTIGGRTRSWYDLGAADLDAFGPIDLVVVDGPPRESDPEARYPALPLLIDRLAPDAVVVLDDALRKEEHAALTRWQAEYPGFAVETLPTAKGIAVLRRGTAPLS